MVVPFGRRTRTILLAIRNSGTEDEAVDFHKLLKRLNMRIRAPPTAIGVQVTRFHDVNVALAVAGRPSAQDPPLV